ncbi:hypothetical protein EVAR_59918_1 [Eumeta japonica]|uniref:Uncharacterized protein n=1 Tax=Eumeta variegata TaxID=151549 RepID=A0A4C1YTD0_EUMVA|nr:hypothetical protein EVAR_59918_1 [Eumeta japonica]
MEQALELKIGPGSTSRSGPELEMRARPLSKSRALELRGGSQKRERYRNRVQKVDVLKNDLNKDTENAIIKEISGLKDCFTSASSLKTEIKVRLSPQAVDMCEKKPRIGASICRLAELLQDMCEKIGRASQLQTHIPAIDAAESRGTRW